MRTLVDVKPKYVTLVIVGNGITRISTIRADEAQSRIKEYRKDGYEVEFA